MADDAHVPRATPDPTVRTLDTVRESTQFARDYTDGRVAVIEERLSGIDRATELLNETVTRVPTDVQIEIAHLRELVDKGDAVTDERFASVATQFQERDIRTSQQQDASGAALAAALQAAKELVGAQGEASAAAAVKSETSFTKQIDQIGTIIQTLEKALDARITELKERIDRGEGNTQGVVDQRTQQVADKQQSSANQNVLIGAAGLFMTLIIIALSIAAFAH